MLSIKQGKFKFSKIEREETSNWAVGINMQRDDIFIGGQEHETNKK